MKSFVLSVFFILISINTYAAGIEDYSLPLDKTSGFELNQDDQLHTLVSSITTTDKSLFPGVGQIILHTASEDEGLIIKGLLVVSPDDITKYIYISLAKINRGGMIDVLKAKKYGVTITVLKVGLVSSKKVNPNKGGLLKIKILKNGLFGSHFKFKMKLSLQNGDWSAFVKRKGSFVSYKTIHINTSKVGASGVDFQ
jgi:hypothetical protein